MGRLNIKKKFEKKWLRLFCAVYSCAVCCPAADRALGLIRPQ